MLMPYKKRQVIQIGVYRQHGRFQVVWLNPQKLVQFLSFSIEETNLYAKLTARLTADFPQIRIQLRVVGCISPHLTWSKTLILPHSLSVQECERQCQFVLQKELPIALNELWFDYRAKPLKQGFRLDIHAVRRQTAMDFQCDYDKLPLQVLDLMPHAILRAFHFVLSERCENSLYLYQDVQHGFALMEAAHQPQMLQATGNLITLFEQFCRRFESKIERVYFYRTVDCEPIDLPADWNQVTTDAPFIALGNCLWQTTEPQQNISQGSAHLTENRDERD